MAEKYLLFSLEDEKAKKLGEIISSTTARKIVNFLAEKEASESEIARGLGMALNTAEYNLKKLLEAGIIEKSKHFWSVKGRKIETYRVANKLIVISPKKTSVYSKLKGIVPVVLIAMIFSLIIAWYSRAGRLAKTAVSEVGEKALASQIATTIEIYPALWFAFGCLIAIVIFLVWNWKKL